MVVLVRDATLAWIGPVVRALSPEPPWSEDGGRVLQVCLTAPELAAVPVGSRVLLRVRVQDVDWLNLYRPIVADRELRLILWADAAATDALLRGAPDLASWIVRVVEVPAASLPEFAVERMRAALASEREIAWQGPMLHETLAAAGWHAGVVACSASWDYLELLAAVTQPGLPVVTGVDGERDVWRVRFALAHRGRSGMWVASDPVPANVGMLQLSVRQLDWDAAAALLAAAGQPSPALSAAWRNLEPAAVLGDEAAPQRRAHTDAWRLLDRLRALGQDTPEPGLVEALVDAGFVDVAMQLERLRRQRHVTSQPSMRRSDVQRAFVAFERERANSLDELGELHFDNGDAETAFDCFRDALLIRMALLEDEPGHSELRREIVTSHDRFGDISLALGNLEDARCDFEHAVAISRDNVSRDPSNPVDLRMLAEQLARLADLLAATGEHDEARAAGREAVSLLESLDARGTLEAHDKSWLEWLAREFAQSKGG